MPGHLTSAAVRAQIAAGSIEPLYLVTGDDEAEMSAIGTALADSVDEDFRAFNVQRFYGSDAGSTVAAVLDAASTFPLLAPRRVVLLLQAEKALVVRKAKSANRDETLPDEDAESDGGGRTGQLALLKAYAARPHAHATVAFLGAGFAASARGAAQDGPRPEDLRRRSARAARAAGRGVVRDREGLTGPRPGPSYFVVALLSFF
jgi:hypothetical protein